MGEEELWLDGPKLAVWFMEQEGGNYKALGPGTERRIRHWEAGETPKVWTVDRILTERGLHLSMVPDECWLPENPHAGAFRQGLPQEMEDRIAKLIREGLTPTEIAKRTGVSARTAGHRRRAILSNA
jgi:hypothetical protein